LIPCHVQKSTLVHVLLFVVLDLVMDIGWWIPLLLLNYLLCPKSFCHACVVLVFMTWSTLKFSVCLMPTWWLHDVAWSNLAWCWLLECCKYHAVVETLVTFQQTCPVHILLLLPVIVVCICCYVEFQLIMIDFHALLTLPRKSMLHVQYHMAAVFKPQILPRFRMNCCLICWWACFVDELVLFWTTLDLFVLPYYYHVGLDEWETLMFKAMLLYAFVYCCCCTWWCLVNNMIPLLCCCLFCLDANEHIIPCC
jgi:hypothetical protein